MIFSKRPSSTSAAAMQRSDVVAAATNARRILHRRALIGAAAGSLPIPGLDWAVDAALLARLLPRINKEFGLTPEQLDELSPSKREQVQKAIALVGSVLIGKLITRDMVVRLGRAAGMRMTASQAAKYVPIAGQAAAAALGYATLRYLGERHIQDCIRVVEQAELDMPARYERTRRSLDRSEARLKPQSRSKAWWRSGT
ncbi:hypothetical protein [Comamonas composti]|uniref:hypothetical protein n=1 Tax=Comamonas composti TaxID=408558 RepID=UPI00387E0AEF